MNTAQSQPKLKKRKTRFSKVLDSCLVDSLRKSQKLEVELNFDSPLFKDSHILAQRLIDILDFKSYRSRLDKLPLEQLRSIMTRVYQSRIVDQDTILNSKKSKRINAANILSHKSSSSNVLDEQFKENKVKPNALYHLSPTGILNKLDKCKYDWCMEKANRLKEEEEELRSHQVTNRKMLNKNNKKIRSISPSSSSLQQFKIEQRAFDEVEYRRNRKGLSTEEVNTYEQYVQKKFGLIKRSTKVQQWEKEILNMHQQVLNKVHPPEEIGQEDLFQEANLKLAINIDTPADEIDEEEQKEESKRNKNTFDSNQSDNASNKSESPRKFSSREDSPVIDKKLRLKNNPRAVTSRNNINILKSADDVSCLNKKKATIKSKSTFKIDINKLKKNGIALMSPKAAHESALLRQRIDNIHKENQKRLRVRKSKIQIRNRKKLKEFQKQLVDIDKDPKHPMSMRVNPGNFRSVSIKRSVDIRRNTGKLPCIETPQSQSLSSTIQESFESGEITPEMIRELSVYISKKYGVSENMLKDTHSQNITEMKKGMKQRTKDRFIIMLKRIILGKAKPEDFTRENNESNFHSDSIINNFLCDLLGRTKDEFINERMKTFRSNILMKNQQNMKIPNVFSRMKDDVLRRESIIVPLNRTYFTKSHQSHPPPPSIP
ncbi:unnamed protein product [Moneuplotes crassus]|uniref:Uncharacterized protein n=1 Tax=Euplotes crassus TaxID=5936 RepID=A0AAD1Y343_EUPCR|nr:unnamed protein product [Moneuplotes crassus]